MTSKLYWTASPSRRAGRVPEPRLWSLSIVRNRFSPNLNVWAPHVQVGLSINYQEVVSLPCGQFAPLPKIGLKPAPTHKNGDAAFAAATLAAWKIAGPKP